MQNRNVASPFDASQLQLPPGLLEFGTKMFITAEQKTDNMLQGKCHFLLCNRKVFKFFFVKVFSECHGEDCLFLSLMSSLIYCFLYSTSLPIELREIGKRYFSCRNMQDVKKSSWPLQLLCLSAHWKSNGLPYYKYFMATLSIWEQGTLILLEDTWGLLLWS